MKSIFPLLFTLLFFGCTNKNNPKLIKKQSEKKVYFQENSAESLNDKSNYIGFVNFFNTKEKETNEVYIELYFKNNISDKDYEKITKLPDSLIYEDDEISREKFPTHLISKYFYLNGLSKLKIYDGNNKFLTNAHFVRVEYLNETISSKFIAIYKTEKRIKSNVFCYGISNLDSKIETKNYEISNDTIETQKLLNLLNLKKPYSPLNENGKHLKVYNNKRTLSIINSEKSAHIVLTEKEILKTIYTSQNPELILGIQIIPIEINGLPYILAHCGAPESDVFWDELLFFDGKKYTVTERQRLVK